VFAGLSGEQQAEVARRARPVTVAAGEALTRAGEPTSRLFVVHVGRVKVRHLTADGRESIVRVVGPGEVTGEHAFLTGAAPGDDTVALEDTRVCSFDHGDLADLLAAMPGIGVGMLRALAEKLASSERMVAALTSSDVGARVAAYLLDLPATWAGGRAVVHLPMPKNQVASYLGTTPETFSRRLGALASAGLIEVLPERGVAILDPAGLAERGDPAA
jgi:CRP/FNR family transcriptional regulator